MNKKTEKYLDYSLGIPVLLLKAPLIKVRGEWALHINYKKYQRSILYLLAHKAARLTGDEVRVVRKAFEMSVRAFAERFSVKHPSVLKWEAKGGLCTQMGWSTEKDIRLFILDELQESATALRALYRSLKKVAVKTSVPLVLNGRDLAA